jgi:hypothetical protein
LRASRKGAEDARRAFEGEQPVDPEDPSDMRNSQPYENPVTDWLNKNLGLGKAGDRSTDLADSEGNAYRAERDRRMQAMQDAALQKLIDVMSRRKGLEDQPLTAAGRTPRGKAARAAAVDRAREDETNANEDVRRAEQFRAGRSKDVDANVARLKQVTAELRGTRSAIAMGKPGETGHAFKSKPGVGTEANASEVMGAGGGAGKRGFGFGEVPTAGMGKAWSKQFMVEMQPAGPLITQQLADGMKGAQGQTDGAAQQIGEGVKGKLSSVEAASAGQKIMADFAAGITSSGAQAIAAAQTVASGVKAALSGAGGTRSASLGSVVSSGLHDGVT